MQSNSDSQPGTKKRFQWNVASTDIDFMGEEELRLVREGCDCGCGEMTTLPPMLRKPKALGRANGKD